MLGFHRSTDSREGAKAPLKPALYDPPGSPPKAAPGGQAGAPRPAPAAPAPLRDARGAANAPPIDVVAHAGATAAEATHGALKDAPGSKLFIGVNIKLKGVE